MPTEGWNVISDSHMTEVLHRAHRGEDPNMLMVELYANADHQKDDRHPGLSEGPTDPDAPVTAVAVTPPPVQSLREAAVGVVEDILFAVLRRLRGNHA